MCAILAHQQAIIFAQLTRGPSIASFYSLTLLFSMMRFFKFLPGEQRQAFLGGLSEKAS